MKNVCFVCFLLVSGFSITACAQTYTGDMTSEIADLKGFDGISLGISADVYITKGDFSVEVKGPEKSVGNVALSVNGDDLGIGSKRSLRSWSSRGVKVYVSMPELANINIGGAGDVKVETPFDNMNALDIAIGGSGNVTVSGEASKLEVSVAGSGDVDAAGVNAGRAKVSIAGSGDVKVGQVEQLEVSIAGSGDVYYKGNPAIEKSVVGSGDIRKLQ